MRTTLTLDDDVSVTLERVRKARNQSLKAIVNEALRLGLESLSNQTRRRGVFRTRSEDLGRCRMGNVDNIAEALAVAEGEAFE